VVEFPRGVGSVRRGDMGRVEEAVMAPCDELHAPFW
jgi:hypothetical protein